MLWVAACPPASAKPLPRPLIVAVTLVTVVPPVLVTTPPTYMARGPAAAQLLESIGIDWVLFVSLPVRSEKVTAACAGTERRRAAASASRRRRSCRVICG